MSSSDAPPSLSASANTSTAPSSASASVSEDAPSEGQDVDRNKLRPTNIQPTPAPTPTLINLPPPVTNGIGLGLPSTNGLTVPSETTLHPARTPSPLSPIHELPTSPTDKAAPQHPPKPNGLIKRMLSATRREPPPSAKPHINPSAAPLTSGTVSAASSHPPSPTAELSDASLDHYASSGGEDHDPVAALRAWRASSAVPDALPPPPSRTPSMSRGRSGAPEDLPHAAPLPTRERPPSRAPSTTGKSDKEKDDTSHRFNLKDLLNSSANPKLSRKPSASSKKSDSDRGGSQYGDGTAASLTKKYGVCERVAIGKGATSVVRLAHKWDRSEEKLYAVKEFRKRRKNETEKEYVKKLTSEFCISSTLHHINIVETVDLVQDEQHHWCEVMEYCAGGDLYAAIKKGGMSSAEVECCFGQICLGVKYLHSQGVAHRDIKPENLYFNARGHVKIGDYGASTVYRLPWESTIHMSTGLCGSEPYIAPEQFLNKPYDARLVDIWACAVVYYCLHFQELPWRVAQLSDPLYAAYAAACGTASHNAAIVAADKDAIAAAAASARKAVNGEKEKVGGEKEKAACVAAANGTVKEKEKTVVAGPAPSPAYGHSLPSTISNLTPRACRPLLRRMLEPDPRHRALIEDVCAHPWFASIEVCTDHTKKPNHTHTLPCTPVPI